MEVSICSDKVIMGDMNFSESSEHSRKESNAVRIFVSSTFTDMSVERNVLMKKTYPRLKDHFRSLALDFQVVDMRWGVREEAVMENMASKLCVDEIRNTQLASRGTAFLALLGDKYGSCPIPSQISPRHYRTFLKHLREANKSTAILEEWYKLDENSLPPEYLLMPRSEKLAHVHSNDISEVQQRLDERQKWDENQREIGELLQTAAILAFDAGSITEEEKHLYFMAVTEREIRHGILEDEKAEERTICVFREFTDFKATDPRALKYDRQWYKELTHHLDFCRQKVEHFVGQLKLREIFFRRLKRNKFQQRKPRFKNRLRKPEAEIEEAKKEEETVDAKSNAEKKPNADVEKGGEEAAVGVNKPLILHGQSGYGKTALLAKLVMKMGQKPKVPEGETSTRWTPPITKHIIKVIRFLGTSPFSCSIRDVMVSVIRQIRAALCLEEEELPSSFIQLCDYFHDILWSVGELKDVTLIVALDAIDQLNGDNGAYKMLWLPTRFPTNVRVFLSTLDDRYNILENLREVVGEDECYIPVHGMSWGSGWELIETYAQVHHRTFTPQQRNIICDAFRSSPFPMFLKLALEMAKEWKSFSDPATLKLGSTCKELINQLMARLRFQHGRLATKALKYITASKEGLTDEEIEDILSLDDEILQDVYIYHLPPDKEVIRLPPMLWRRIRHQIREYLVEKEADDTTVINWYHRQFWEAARFHLSDTPDVHRDMIYYFTGRWAGKPKPLCLYKGKKAEYPNAQRRVPPMPYEFAPGQPNLRKLNELPYHVIRSFDVQSSGRLLCTFAFLVNKLRYVGLKGLLSDFLLFFHTFAPGEREEEFADLVYLQRAEELHMSVDDHPHLAKITASSRLDVKIVYDTIVMASDILNRSWEYLALTLVGRLDAYWQKTKRLVKLVRDAEEWGRGWSGPLLTAAFPALPSPGSLLRTSINHTLYIPGRGRTYGPEYLGDCLYLSSKNLVYVNEQRWNAADRICVYDLNDNGEMAQVLRLYICVETLRFIKADKSKCLKGRK